MARCGSGRRQARTVGLSAGMQGAGGIDWPVRLRDAIRRAARLGDETLPDGTRLLGRVPHVGPEAWLHVVPAPLTEEAADELARWVGRPLPTSYRSFLTQFANGLSLFSDALSIDGRRKDRSRTAMAAYQPYDVRLPNVKERPRDAPDAWFFVGGYGWDGSLLALDTSREERVLRCDRDTAEVLTVWPALGFMLESEVTRLATLFDRSGRKRNADAPTTPP